MTFLLLADSYLHRLDPFAVQFTETFGLRWYGLAYATGFVIGWAILRWMARTGRSSLTVAGAGDMMFFIIAGVLVGGRVGYAVFYDQQLFIGFTSSFPFWDLLAIGKGGMASHGGMIGVIVALLLFAKRRSIGRLHVLDLGAFICPPGLFLGRLANFVNAELWGKALPATMQANPPAWSVKYPEEILLAGFPHKAELVTNLQPLVGGEATFYTSVIDAARAGNEQVIDALSPLLTAYYPSQIFQAITDGPVLMAVLVLVWLKPRRPGVVGSWFLIAYGILRIVSELFRQPDEGVALLLGLSRGQTLSVLMIVSGLITLVICARRPVEPGGGLLRRPS